MRRRALKQLPAGVSPVNEHSIALVPLAADIRALDLARVGNRNALLWNAQREHDMYFDADADDAHANIGGGGSDGDAQPDANSGADARADPEPQTEAETAQQQRWRQWQQNWQGASAVNNAGTASSEEEARQKSPEALAAVGHQETNLQSRSVGGGEDYLHHYQQHHHHVQYQQQILQHMCRESHDDDDGETLEQQLLRGVFDLQAVCERRLDADVELLLRTTSCMGPFLCVP
jgi:hypothetical protein